MAVYSFTSVLLKAPMRMARPAACENSASQIHTPTIGSDIDNWGRTDLQGNLSILCAYAIDEYTSSERCLRRCALAFPTTRRRSLLSSSALQSCTALFSRLDFLCSRLPTHDVPSWRSPYSNCRFKILCNLETMMACFLVRHRWWRGDTH